MAKKKISQAKFIEISDNFRLLAREIDKSIFQYIFENESEKLIIRALKPYQNDDGGFGHGLEPDFRLPLSTPMATSIGLRILDQLPDSHDKQEIIAKTEKYLIHTYDVERKGWIAVRKEVNNYPHTPWWHYDIEKNMSIIDHNWGNPTAEILGYLIKYRILFSAKMHKIIDECLDQAKRNLLDRSEFGSENEIYCFLVLYYNLNKEFQLLFYPKICDGINQLVVLNSTEWNKYVPQPVDFLPKSQEELFSLTVDSIDQNLDFLVDKFNRLNQYNPTWEFPYPDTMKMVPTEWVGQLSLKYLKILKNYGRIEKN